jgi:hypothetical protein
MSESERLIATDVKEKKEADAKTPRDPVAGLLTKKAHKAPSQRNEEIVLWWL